MKVKKWIVQTQIDLKSLDDHIGGFLRFLEIRKIKVQKMKNVQAQYDLDQMDTVCIFEKS